MANESKKPNGDNLTLGFKKRKRVIIFIDGNHLFHRMWDIYKTHLLDIQELARKLCSVNRELVKIKYYYSPFIQDINQSMYKEQQKYIERIKLHDNVDITEGKYIKKPVLLKKSVAGKIKHLVTKEELETYVEKGIDVCIAVDMIHLAWENAFDVAVLVSGDSDFIPAIEQVRKLKKKVQVTCFIDAEHRCYHLRSSGNSFQNLRHIIPPILKSEKATP